MDEGKKDEIRVCDDGAVLVNGRLLDEDEQAAAAEQATPLGDVLPRISHEVAQPGIHSPEIAAILAAPDTPAHRAARQQRLDNINRLLAEANTEDENKK